MLSLPLTNQVYAQVWGFVGSNKMRISRVLCMERHLDRKTASSPIRRSSPLSTWLRPQPLMGQRNYLLACTKQYEDSIMNNLMIVHAFGN